MERREEPMTRLGPDWTLDRSTGRTNSAPEFLALVGVVDHLIRSEFSGLDQRASENAARLIMAHLAHKHGLRPRYFTDPTPATEERSEP